MKDLRGLGGQALSSEDVRDIESRLGLQLPAAFVQIVTGTPLVGLTFGIDGNADLSGLGVDLVWMSRDQTISEGIETYPGIVAVPAGFVPVGIDLGGSGDPYFVRLNDLALVRIPHDAARGGQLHVEEVEVVAASIEEFIDQAVVAL